MKGNPDPLIFLAEDNGIGFEPGEFSGQKQALGLLSMRERAAMLGGNFTLRTSKGNGTRIRIEIPVKESSHDRYISELIGLGASGYLLKDATGGEIVKAVAAAMKGDVYLSPSISRRVIDDYLTLKKTSSQEDLYTKLSNREREVFQMIAEGHSTKKIADILCVSPSTVKTHRANIMEKLQLENISQLIQFAIRLGIVDVQSQDIDS